MKELNLLDMRYDCQVFELIARNRYCYTDCSKIEKRNLIAARIKELDYTDKSTLLVDADRETELPDLVAEVISNRKVEKLMALLEKLDELFLGEHDKESYFESRVDMDLEVARERKRMDTECYDERETGALKVVGA